MRANCQSQNRRQRLSDRIGRLRGYSNVSAGSPLRKPLNYRQNRVQTSLYWKTGDWMAVYTVIVERVSAPNSLLNRENTGKNASFGRFCENSHAYTAEIIRVFPEFPINRNREINSHNRESKIRNREEEGLQQGSRELHVCYLESLYSITSAIGKNSFEAKSAFGLFC